jgi:hypothetical protein
MNAKRKTFLDFAFLLLLLLAVRDALRDSAKRLKNLEAIFRKESLIVTEVKVQ